MIKMIRTLGLCLCLIVSYAHTAEGISRVEIPNGIYAEACADGSYAAVIWNSHIQVGSVGFVRPSIPLPGENILYLRGSCDATGRLCGTGGSTDTAWYFNGAQWENWGLAFGTNACIFNAQGKAVFVQGAGEPTGSQGFRYVDSNGWLVPAYTTYADPVRQIYEYTERAPYTVGQGPEDGCRVLTPQARVLEGGACRFVHYNKNGGVNAVGLSKLGEGRAVVMWLTDAEMLNLPLVEKPPPPPLEEICGDGIDNDKDGLIDENPPCEPPAQETPNDSEIVVQTNQAVPELLERNTHEDACKFTLTAAQNLNAKDANWGLLSKPPGQNGCDFSFGRVAVDAVIYLKTQQVVDIISAAGDGTPTVTTWAHKPKRPDNNWMKPPEGEDPDPPDDLEDRVAVLEQKVKDLEVGMALATKQLSAQQVEIDNLWKRVESIEGGGVSEAEVIKMITSAFAAARVAGSTGRSSFHSHTVNLEVFLEWSGVIK